MLAPDPFRLSNMCLADQRGNDESEDRDGEALIRGQSRFKIHLAAGAESHFIPPPASGNYPNAKDFLPSSECLSDLHGRRHLVGRRLRDDLGNQSGFPRLCGREA